MQNIHWKKNLYGYTEAQSGRKYATIIYFIKNMIKKKEYNKNLFLLLHICAIVLVNRITLNIEKYDATLPIGVNLNDKIDIKDPIMTIVKIEFKVLSLNLLYIQ